MTMYSETRRLQLLLQPLGGINASCYFIKSYGPSWPVYCATMSIGSAYTSLSGMWVSIPKGAPIDVELAYTKVKVVAAGECRVSWFCADAGDRLLLRPAFYRLHTTDGSRVEIVRCTPQ